jgi:hypothetical protein
MEAVRSSKRPTNFHQSARCHIPEDGALQTQCRENPSLSKRHVWRVRLWVPARYYTDNCSEPYGRVNEVIDKGLAHGIREPAAIGAFSLRHRIQAASVAQLSHYRGAFPRRDMAGAIS